MKVCTLWDSGVDNRTILVVLSIAIMSLVGIGFQDYFSILAQKHNNIISNANNVTNRLSAIMVDPVWDMESTKVNKMISVEMQDPKIKGIVLKEFDLEKPLICFERNEQGEIVSGDGVIEGEFIKFTKKLSKDTETIGNIELYFSPTVSCQEKFHTAISVTVKMFILGCVLLLSVLLILKSLSKP